MCFKYSYQIWNTTTTSFLERRRSDLQQYFRDLIKFKDPAADLQEFCKASCPNTYIHMGVSEGFSSAAFPEDT